MKCFTPIRHLIKTANSTCADYLLQTGRLTDCKDISFKTRRLTRSIGISFKIRIAALCLVPMFIVSIAGCGEQINPGDESAPPPPIALYDTTEPVNLTWVVPGDKPEDADLVFAEVNKKLKEDINTTIAMKYVPWQTWSGQAETIIASDSAPDVLYVASWSNYSRLAAKNLLMEVDEEMIAKYAPSVATALQLYTAEGLKDCEIDGKAYMIPSVGNLWVEDFPVLIRGDYRERFGLNEVRTLDELDEYLKIVARAGLPAWGADGEGLSTYLKLSWFQPNGMIPVIEDFPFLAYKLGDEKAIIQNAMGEKTFADALLRLRSLAIEGALPENALYSRMPAVSLWQSEQSACLLSNLETIAEQYELTKRNHPEWKVELCYLNPDAKRYKQPVNRQGLSLPVASPEPERFFMVLDLLFRSKDLQDLTVSGMPNVHYNASVDYYDPTVDAKKYPYNHMGVWAWKNKDIVMKPSSGPWILKDIYDRYTTDESKLEKAVLSTFLFDMTPVSQQLSELQTTLGSVGQFLLAGVSDNVTTDIQKLQEAFVEAGIETVKAEMQLQVDAFLVNR